MTPKATVDAAVERVKNEIITTQCDEDYGFLKDLKTILTALDEARKDTERLLDASKQALGAIQKVADITDENRLGWALKSEAIDAMKERGD